MNDFAKKPKLGLTGAFPCGRLSNTDKGELRMAVTNDGQRVRLDFGNPVTWLSFPPNEAKVLASLLMQHAACCKNLLS